MAKKRVTRKKLLKEPDEFITLAGKIIRFAKTYKTRIVVMTCGVLAIILIMIGLKYYIKLSETKAFAMLDKGVATYELSFKNNGSQKAYKDVQNSFEAIIDEYPGRNGGKIAKVIYANICYNAGDYEKAVDLYKKALEDFSNDSLIKNMVLSSLGHTYEKRGDYKTAAEYFEKVAAGDILSLKDEAYFNLGAIYFQIGEKAKGNEYFKKIMTHDVDSIYINMVEEKIAG